MYLSPVSDETKPSSSSYTKSSTSGTSKPTWKMRSSRYARNSRREKRERHPSICSDSETESSTMGTGAADDLCLSVPTPKKWSLPLPIVPRGSESDSTSSSWSARSNDETEDERSPVPSPSPSTHSAESRHVTFEEPEILHQPEPSTSSSASHSPSRSKCKKGKKLSKSAETHKLQRLKTTNYGRCKICDTYVYFWGYRCAECELISHKKCLKKMTIMCAKKPLPPKSNIIGLELAESSEEVPTILVKCANEIERRSCGRPGIYRMTGVPTRVEKLLKSFESGPHLIDVSDVNPNDLTAVLKEFLRELKFPLITNDVYRDFINIGRIYSAHRVDPLTTTNSSELTKALKEAVDKLHNNHKATLAFLMHHLRRITNCQHKNSMTASSMGIIFAPTIFRPRDNINDLYTEVFEAAPQARVIELMIFYVTEVFGPTPPVTYQSTSDYQPSTSSFNFPSASELPPN